MIEYFCFFQIGPVPAANELGRQLPSSFFLLLLSHWCQRHYEVAFRFHEILYKFIYATLKSLWQSYTNINIYDSLYMPKSIMFTFA